MTSNTAPECTQATRFGEHADKNGRCATRLDGTLPTLTERAGRATLLSANALWLLQPVR